MDSAGNYTEADWQRLAEIEDQMRTIRAEESRRAQDTKGRRSRPAVHKVVYVPNLGGV